MVGAPWILLEVEAGVHTYPELRLEHFQSVARSGDECAYSPLRRHMYLFLLGLGGLRSHIWVSSGVRARVLFMAPGVEGLDLS